MTFLGYRLWFCSYHLQGFDTGLSTRESVQHDDPNVTVVCSNEHKTF